MSKIVKKIKTIVICFFKFKWLQVQSTLRLEFIITTIGIIICFTLYECNYKKLSNEKLKLDIEIDQRKFNNELKLALYKEVKDAIVQKDTALQIAAWLIVENMLEEDTVSFKDGLQTLLYNTKSFELRKMQKNLDNYREEENALNVNVFTIDIFYLEDIVEEAKERAEKLYYLLCSKYPKYTIRQRLLPKTVNARKGYRIDSNQIRFDKGTEEEQLAKDIKNYIQDNKIFEKEQPILQGINNKTENYMSIFVRNM